MSQEQPKRSYEGGVYPKWLIALMGVNLLSLLLSPFFLFGGVSAAAESGIVRFLAFLGVNLFWLVPCGCFFLGLDTWGKGHRAVGIGIGIAGIIITACGAYYLTTLL